MTMTQREAGEWAIGVDVGGTKVAAGFVDACMEPEQALPGDPDRSRPLWLKSGNRRRSCPLYYPCR